MARRIKWESKNNQVLDPKDLFKMMYVKKDTKEVRELLIGINDKGQPLSVQPLYQFTDKAASEAELNSLTPVKYIHLDYVEVEEPKQA